jgi:hypothetical protein
MLQNHLLLWYGHSYLNRTITPIPKDPHWKMFQNKWGLTRCPVVNLRGWPLTWFPWNPLDHYRKGNQPLLKRFFNSFRTSIFLQDEKNQCETLMKPLMDLPPCLSRVDIAPLKMNWNVGRIFLNPNKTMAPRALQNEISNLNSKEKGYPSIYPSSSPFRSFHFLTKSNPHFIFLPI